MFVRMFRSIATPAPKLGGLLPRKPIVIPKKCDLAQLAALLNSGGRVTILCGSRCAGAHDELLALGEKLQAPMVHALRRVTAGFRC
jgi:pyruvate dehydrogenase (quinone)